MATSEWVFEVNEDDFERAVIEKSRTTPVVVDFWAPWCGPCRMLAPRLEKAIEARNGAVVLAKVNTDENQGLARKFRIEGIPDVRGFRDGKVVAEFRGLVPEVQITAFLDRLMPSEGDNLLKDARAKEEQAPAEAERAYRAILEKERDHPAATLGLARVLLGRNQHAEAGDLLERFVPTGEDVPEAEKLRATVALRKLAAGLPDAPTLRGKVAGSDTAEVRYQLGSVLAASARYKEALDELLAAAEKDKELARSKVKEAMVSIFHVIGTRSELADEYRDKLTRLLY